MRIRMVNDLSKSRNLVGSALAIAALAGCSGNAAAPPEAVTVVSPASAKAQIAVGTANIFGTPGLNIVATLRTPQGKSVLLTTPTVTGPFALPATAGSPDSTGATIVTGPSASEIATGGIISASAQVAPGTPASQIPATTFGTRGGLFAGGFQPSNADNLGTVRSLPYAVPAYDTIANDPDAFAPIGGPPAFDPNGNGQGTRDGTFDPSILGVNEGITVFAGVKPATGAYNLSVVIPSNAGSTTIAASTNLAALTTLGAVTAPTFLPDGAGGGSFAVTLPAGATDGIVEIVDNGPALCHLGNPGTAYYSIHVTGSGNATLPDLDGPRTASSPFAKTPTICTAAQNSAVTAATAGDTFSVTLVGADYPLYGSNYLFNLNTQLPTILGPNGSDDITISHASVQTST